MLRVIKWLLAALVCTAAMIAPASYAATSDEIKALLEQGKAADAYAAGRDSPDQLGNPAFDFYFGIAAIDSGHAGEGVLALERYLLSFPDNVSARLQISRGYFLLGEDARAREEFEALQKLNPPADVSATIQRFLDAIRLRESRYSLSGGAFVEFGVGHDSNINGGVTSALITLPGPFFTAVGPVPGPQKISDDFATLGAGGYVSYPLRPGIALYVNGQGERRFNASSSDKQFELGNYSLGGGVSVLREKNLYRLGLNYGVITLGTSTYRDYTGISGEWRHQLDERQSFNFGAQFAELSYSDTATTVNTPRDADFWGLSAGYRRLFDYPWQPVLSVGLNLGRQDSRTGRPDLTPRNAGVSAELSFTPAAKWGVSLGYTYQQSDYLGPDLFLGETRHDKYEAVNAALSYLVSRNITLRAEALTSRNRSNIALYDFPRDVYLLKVRYEFK